MMGECWTHTEVGAAPGQQGNNEDLVPLWSRPPDMKLPPE